MLSFNKKVSVFEIKVFILLTMVCNLNLASAGPLTDQWNERFENSSLLTDAFLSKLPPLLCRQRTEHKGKMISPNHYQLSFSRDSFGNYSMTGLDAEPLEIVGEGKRYVSGITEIFKYIKEGKQLKGLDGKTINLNGIHEDDLEEDEEQAQPLTKTIIKDSEFTLELQKIVDLWGNGNPGTRIKHEFRRHGREEENSIFIRVSIGDSLNFFICSPSTEVGLDSDLDSDSDSNKESGQ